VGDVYGALRTAMKADPDGIIGKHSELYTKAINSTYPPTLTQNPPINWSYISGSETRIMFNVVRGIFRVAIGEEYIWKDNCKSKLCSYGARS
jgi:hypothetical protein